ncbi:MAG TPA: galactokinase [Deltaproteobacteria bacterium]|nr:galactokinase [Deltaproteobacteria bacterium]
MVDVTAVILAGGLGTRLRSVLQGRPKVLAEIQGRPFLAYLLSQLSISGLRTVVLCTGYLGGQIQDRFGDSYRNLGIVYSREGSLLGTAGALRLALPLFKSSSVLVMNGDSFCDIDLHVFWDWHCGRRAAATLALVRMVDSMRYGQVRMESDGALLSFEEKSGRGEPGWVNAGIYLLTLKFIQAIPENRAISLEKEVFPAWIGRGLYGYQTEGRFLDIGIPETYGAAKGFFSPEKT